MEGKVSERSFTSSASHMKSFSNMRPRREGEKRRRDRENLSYVALWNLTTLCQRHLDRGTESTEDAYFSKLVFNLHCFFYLFLFSFLLLPLDCGSCTNLSITSQCDSAPDWSKAVYFLTLLRFRSLHFLSDSQSMTTTHKNFLPQMSPRGTKPYFCTMLPPGEGPYGKRGK